MNASLPFGPPINTDIDYYQAFVFCFGWLCDVSDAWFVRVMFGELNIPISLEEVKLAIGQLSNGKSGGPDKLLNEFFIHGKEILLSTLHILFNAVLDKGYFPKEWTLGEIIPLHKKGDKANVQNYRGITLQSTLSKLFTRILNNRLTSWAEEYGIYIEAQAGFRQRMSTVDNVFVLNSL